MLKLFALFLLGYTFFTTLSGCGIQGPLEAPPSSEKNAPPDKSLTKNDKENDKPQKGFFLDRLLR